jgi:hypothetical protein
MFGFIGRLFGMLSPGRILFLLALYYFFLRPMFSNTYNYFLSVFWWMRP